ncbi:hypothetical protein ES319_D08G202800v1 [Gossypium barbadense]|uniref:UBC core domain-containing protein n=3 Tax=Gossypium TaxID=3633 RepID=A0A5J5QI00_GOSBA|nr:hypothetical protein ES319_D08G202800v1 [Gossypium barbadense]KAB2018034.1 hypothetical protein ES319_D08G202800v1 [Gossypium barbadense]KAB2018036.1 hypothetical protein ES319_D08G202800v1 [Gossypium barbadense]TYG58340.1 hypothetical protein ES288_D08G215000v1 [Gossypium darwinii]TYH59252.1 hypothetical protein ES332_D08G210900v1 [Gossypium tomentosum]
MSCMPWTDLNKIIDVSFRKRIIQILLKRVMEKLVDIIHFLHLEIHEAFGAAGISGAPQDNNIMLWNAVIFGLDDTPWDGEGCYAQYMLIITLIIYGAKIISISR